MNSLVVLCYSKGDHCRVNDKDGNFKCKTTITLSAKNHKEDEWYCSDTISIQVQCVCHL